MYIARVLDDFVTLHGGRRGPRGKGRAQTYEKLKSDPPNIELNMPNCSAGLTDKASASMC